MRLLRPAAHSIRAAVARLMCHLLIISAAAADVPLAVPPPPFPSPPPPSPPKSPSPCPPPPPLRAVVPEGMRLELRFLGGHGRAPNAHALLVELGSALGVEPQGRIKVQETRHAPNSPLSYALFDLLPPNNVGLGVQPSAAELAARLVTLVGGMRCDSMLDNTEVWSSDECLSGRESLKLAVDDKYDTLANGTYPPSWHACARDGSYEYEQTLRVRLRPPLPPGQPLLLRLVAPESGTAAFDNQVTPQLGSDGGGGFPRFQGQLGPAAPCVATAGGAVELQDGGVSVAACSSSATTDSEWLYLSGSGRGRLGEEGAGGLALAEVQACRPDSSSRLFTLAADGSFLYPTLARVDVRAGLQQYSTTGDGGHDYLCGGLGKPCVKTTRSSLTTQLMPELVARHFDAGSSEGIGWGLTAVVLGLLLLGLAGACCVSTNFWRARRAWQLERERDQIERVQLHDEMYGDDDVHRQTGKNTAPGSKTPLDSALRKVSQLAPVIR